MTAGSLRSTTIAVATGEHIASQMGDEVIILNLKNGTYYGLDEVGAFVWNQIQEPRQVSAIRDAILERYEVDPEQCERDLLMLLESMVAQGLVDVRAASYA